MADQNYQSHRFPLTSAAADASGRANEHPLHPGSSQRPAEAAAGAERTSSPRPRRGERIHGATDEATRLRRIEAAQRRREERIQKSAARQRKRKERRLRQRRQALLQRHLPDDNSADWESPRVRRLLDRVLTDARERRLVLLPPKADVQAGGIRRIVGHRPPPTK